jgi:hypothetical protein
LLPGLHAVAPAAGARERIGVYSTKIKPCVRWGQQGLGRGGRRHAFPPGERQPNTPITGATYDVRTAFTCRTTARPTAGGDRLSNSSTRSRKRVAHRGRKLAAYLDVQNVYMAKNPEGYRISFDYSKREAVSAVAFPNLGLRGEL